METKTDLKFGSVLAMDNKLPLSISEYPAEQQVHEGLEGVLVARTAISDVNGDIGALQFRGIDIRELAQSSTYEEVVYLLWTNALPTPRQLEAFKAELAVEREVDAGIYEILRFLSHYMKPMDALRTAVSVLASDNPGEDNVCPESCLKKAMSLTAKFPTLVAYYCRESQGKMWVHPDPRLGQAENFLYMMHGKRPTPLEARAMDLTMLLMVEHSFNASTFAARVTASTLADMGAAITSAMGTLKGPLHGGANQGALEMLLEIGTLDNVEPYIDAALAAKQRILGFGHRIYRKAGDSRVPYIKDMLYQLCAQSGDFHLYELATAVADAVWQRKRLFANVDFYMAPTLHMLGIPVDLLTPFFAMCRMAGWTAHVMEQYANNRLIRPNALYVGPVQRPYIPLDRRADFAMMAEE
ncbi:MAG TPA: citrate/2-methylcitrate synthase [Anaerolineae bacterium]|nr:citrate/2-methylcitrate synthase [Anaerolineae bacterium]HQH37033.1 citrate/2-methylcitrate synthase [Anaerolineae bacterium]